MPGRWGLEPGTWVLNAAHIGLQDRTLQMLTAAGRRNRHRHLAAWRHTCFGYFRAVLGSEMPPLSHIHITKLQ
jgi:hypothetical protein